jgi:probable HAF family extracellular repeat protein
MSSLWDKRIPPLGVCPRASAGPGAPKDKGWRLGTGVAKIRALDRKLREITMTFSFSLRRLFAGTAGVISMSVLAAPSYHVVDLGSQGEPRGINQRAQIAGDVAGARHEQAAKYRAGRWKVLADQGHGSQAYGIDNEDDLVGRIFQKGGVDVPALWPKHEHFEIIPLPYASQFGEADAIAPGGKLVVGTGIGTNFQPRCFSWPRTGTAVDLGTLGGDACIPHAVNDAGQIAGQSNLVAGQPTHAFLITDGVMRDLGTLPGGSFSFLSALNASGHGAGQSDLVDDANRHAIFWDGHQLVDLGSTTIEATGMNDLDDIVGIGTDGTGIRAFLYHAGTLAFLDQLVDNGAGWSFNDAAYIDNGGVIIGNGVFQGRFHMYKLVPM